MRGLDPRICRRREIAWVKPGDDEKEAKRSWIPAFAGMTKEETQNAPSFVMAEVFARHDNNGFAGMARECLHAYYRHGRA
jgi:hypothetical protein